MKTTEETCLLKKKHTHTATHYSDTNNATTPTATQQHKEEKSQETFDKLQFPMAGYNFFLQVNHLQGCDSK